jgi:ABC-2 type transport system permease protein
MSWIIESTKLEAKRIFSYRVDFWMQFVVTAFAEVVIAYYLWLNVYEQNPQKLIGGYDFHHMLFYYIFVPLVGRAVRSQEDWSTAREIYEGGLTKFLIFPISFISYKFLQKIVYSGLSVFQMFLALLVVQFVLHIDIPWNLQNFALGLVATFVSMILYSTISTTLELVAFWADVVWSLGVMLRFIAMFFGGAMIPLSLFPEWSHQIVYASPFPYMFSVPIRTFLGELTAQQSIQGILITCLWVFPFWGLMLFTYKRGLKNYTGVGI